jgi:hypothetical protein
MRLRDGDATAEPAAITDASVAKHVERNERADRPADAGCEGECEKGEEVGDEQCGRRRDDHLAREKRKEHRRLEEGKQAQRERALEPQEVERDRRRIHPGEPDGVTLFGQGHRFPRSTSGTRCVSREIDVRRIRPVAGAVHRRLREVVARPNSSETVVEVALAATS